MERVKSISKALESIFRFSCSIDNGTIFNEGYLLRFTTEDPVQSTSRSFYKSYGNVSLHVPSGRTESLSPSKTKKLIVRQGDRRDENTWELWENNRLKQVKNCKDSHGEISSNPTFGGIAWSSDEQFVAYVAEDVAEKSGSFWSGDKNPGKQNVLKEDFGEGLSGFSNPVLFVYSFKENSIRKVKNERVHPAQVAFRPETRQLVYVGYEKHAFHISLAQFNRESKLFCYDIETEETIDLPLPSNLVGAVYPKFNYTGNVFSYYGIPEDSLGHGFCMPLYLFDCDSKESSVLVDIVNECNSEFNGIYGYQSTLQKNGWVNDTTIVFQTLNRLTDGMYSVSIGGQVKQVPVPAEGLYCTNLLSIANNKILFTLSQFSSLPKAFVSELSGTEWSTTLLEDNPLVPVNEGDGEFIEILNSAKCQVVQHRTSDMESILYYTNRENPLIIQIHGGPHGGITSSYSCLHLLRLYRGFNVLICNYRGSTGFGESNLRAVLGNLGTVDVADCIDALDSASEYVSIDNTVSIGASHGGNLSVHLAVRGKVRASVVTNGSTNLSMNALISDSPDWVFAECFSSKMQLPPTVEQLDYLYRVSPISKVEDISVPVLIVAGGSDKCVRPGVSIGLYRLLKALGKDVKFLLYEKEGHSISSRAASYDYAVNTLIWMEEKLLDK